MGNPIDDFFGHRKSAASQRAEADLDRWHNWNNNGRQPGHLEPLLKSFKPVITQAVNTYRAPTVQKSAFEAAATKQAIEAFETYNPNAGAALATWVIGRMKKLQRENNKLQNKAYIPEGKAGQIGKIQRAQSFLREDLEREPTVQEIAKQMGRPVKQIQGVLGAMKKDIVASQFENDPTKIPTAREQEVLDLLPYSLTHEQKEVFDHLYGLNGKRRILETNEIAAALGKNPSQVSRIRTSILTQFQDHMKRSF
jgi:DNA-directed RNA polymerase specialized sigma subunit